MEKRRSKRKRPVGRPATGQRPVIAMRMHPDLYERVVRSAATHKHSIAEEAARQIELAFEWQGTIDEMRRLTTTIDGARELLRAHGFRQIHLDAKGSVMWAEPGVPDAMRWSTSVDAAAVVEAMKPKLAEVLAEAIEQVKRGGKK